MANSNDVKRVKSGDKMMVGADLEGAKLGKRFGRIDLSGVDFYRANLAGADLHKAILIGAELQEVNFTGANLSNAILSGADLTSADLSDANLKGADLHNTGSLSLTRYTAKTIWPTGFSPPSSALLIDSSGNRVASQGKTAYSQRTDAPSQESIQKIIMEKSAAGHNLGEFEPVSANSYILKAKCTLCGGLVMVDRSTGWGLDGPCPGAAR